MSPVKGNGAHFQDDKHMQRVYLDSLFFHTSCTEPDDLKNGSRFGEATYIVRRA